MSKNTITCNDLIELKEMLDAHYQPVVPVERMFPNSDDPIGDFVRLEKMMNEIADLLETSNEQTGIN